MKFEVSILGCSSATPVYNRNPSAQLLNCNDQFFLIDCGEGTQHQLLKYNLKSSKIDHILISHLHGDHYFGLIGLLSSLHLNGRMKPMHIFGPKGLKEILDLQFKYSDTNLNYPLIFKEIQAETPELIFENDDLQIETIILNHRIPCTGFKFSQKLKLRRLIKEKVESLSVAYYSALKRGKDIELPSGEILKNVDYTLDPHPVRSYAYCSDTLMDERYFPSILNCTTLYHEATFMHDLLERAQQTHHTTAYQAAEVANINGVERLIIGHFSSRYKTLEQLFDEARTHFPNTHLALEGKKFIL